MNTEHILHLGLIKRHFTNNRIWVKFIPGKLSLKSSKGFFPSFRAGRLLKPKNTMYFTHTSQSQHMLKKKVGLTKNWENLSSELAFGSLRERWVFFMYNFKIFILKILLFFISIMILLSYGGRIQNTWRSIIVPVSSE